MSEENIAVGKYWITAADLARMIEAGQKSGMKGALQEYEKIAKEDEQKLGSPARVCPQCAKVFAQRSYNQKYCSYHCRWVHQAQKRKDG